MTTKNQNLLGLADHEVQGMTRTLRDRGQVLARFDRTKVGTNLVDHFVRVRLGAVVQEFRFSSAAEADAFAGSRA